MRIAQIGRWEFEMPDGWEHKANEACPSYFEDPDGSKGLYVKVVELPEPEQTPLRLAEYVQNVHLHAFCELADTDWEIVDSRCSEGHGFARSALDLYDAKASYRILSLVVCNCRSALQITVHDYWCEHSADSRDAFAQLESSITWLPSEA
jgi:hypothetical protein